MGVDGDSNCMKNLHQTQHHQQLVQDHQGLLGDGPVSDALPKHFAGVGDRAERRNKKQHTKDGIDNDFGSTEIVAEVDAELLFSHDGSPGLPRTAYAEYNPTPRIEKCAGRRSRAEPGANSTIMPRNRRKCNKHKDELKSPSPPPVCGTI